MKRIFKIFTIILIFISAILFTVNATEFSAKEIYDLAATDTADVQMRESRIGNIITIIQVLSVYISPIIIVISGIIYIRAKKKDDEKKIKKAKTILLVCVIVGIILLTVASIVEMFKSFDKPIIYIYPETEQKVSVKLVDEEKITCSYPKYEDGWEVLAKPNGDLTDCKTGRDLYALYWEGEGKTKTNYEEGFIVKGEDSLIFLEEKLEILGLNEREAEEFIVYWLPELEKNKYNYIRFQTLEEINELMPLEIEPKPDTIIRVMMQFKPVLIPFEVEEQKLETPERKGFTVVEWGGTRL